MRALDAQEQLVWDSEVCAAVVGKAGEFLLIRLDENGEGDELLMEAAARKGWAYCGVLGVKDGQAGAKCQPGADAIYTMMHAALAFAQEMAVAGRLRPKDDSARWLEELYRLPDTRA